MQLVPRLATVAQSSQPAQTRPVKGGVDATSIIVWAGVLIAVIMVGGLLLMWLRRRMFMADSMEQAGGLMESLRKMRDTGQMSQEEYDAARKAMAARVAKVDLAPKKLQSPDNS
jgi:hypothetical protein